MGLQSPRADLHNNNATSLSLADNPRNACRASAHALDRTWDCGRRPSSYIPESGVHQVVNTRNASNIVKLAFYGLKTVSTSPSLTLGTSPYQITQLTAQELANIDANSRTHPGAAPSPRPTVHAIFAADPRNSQDQQSVRFKTYFHDHV